MLYFSQQSGHKFFFNSKSSAAAIAWKNSRKPGAGMIFKNALNFTGVESLEVHFKK